MGPTMRQPSSTNPPLGGWTRWTLNVLGGYVDVGDTTTPRSPAGGTRQPAAALKRLQPGNQVQPPVPPRTAKSTILSGIALPARRSAISRLRQEESPVFRPTALPRSVKRVAGQLRDRR
jgi:hypothetical protein